MKTLLISSALVLSTAISLPVKANITAATDKTKDQISSCVTNNLDALSDASYKVMEQVKPLDTPYTSTEYIVFIKGQKSPYRFSLNSWDNSRVLSLHSPEQAQKSDQRLKDIVVNCG